MKDRWLVLLLIFTPVVLILTYLTVAGPRISPVYLPIAVAVSMLVVMYMRPAKSPTPTPEARVEQRRNSRWLLPSGILVYIVTYAISKKYPQASLWGYSILTILAVGYYVSWQRAQK